jgi:hypothetical protein
MEPTKSAMHDLAGHWPAQEPGWLVECLRLGVGHASTVWPDPSTLGVVGERGARLAIALLGGALAGSGPGTSPYVGAVPGHRHGYPSALPVQTHAHDQRAWFRLVADAFGGLVLRDQDRIGRRARQG